MLTQIAHEIQTQDSKENEKTTGIHTQTNKRICTGMEIAYKANNKNGS
jgi:hypothetical protein